MSREYYTGYIHIDGVLNDNILHNYLAHSPKYAYLHFILIKSPSPVFVYVSWFKNDYFYLTLV